MAHSRSLLVLFAPDLQALIAENSLCRGSMNLVTFINLISERTIVGHWQKATGQDACWRDFVRHCDAEVVYVQYSSSPVAPRYVSRQSRGALLV